MSDEENEHMEVNEETDSSSSSDDEDNLELIQKAEELEREISSNKYLYDAHVEIVDLYRKIGDLNSMRAAYERFHEYFPLTPKLWLDWLKDEIKIASTEDEQKRLFILFDKAVEDYVSVELWIEYAQFSIGVSNIETTRSILERGLSVVGLHVSKGSLLWDTLRELEHAHISLTSEGTEEWKVQINRLADVFKRQLSVPLLNMDGIYEEWQEWFKSLPENVVDPKPIEWGYKNAVKTLEIYKPYEERLLAIETNEELLEAYKNYIKIVKDPSTILCLYERAVVKLCLVPSLWIDYCDYALKLGETAVKISGRALRNCPWSEDLWVIRLRILESKNAEENEILTCFEQGIASISPSPGLELWLCYLEYVHRNSKNVEKLDKLFSQAIEQLGFENDPACKISRWNARLLAKRGDMTTARKIWSTILHQPQNKGTASVWLEYANLERQYGEGNHVRNIFQRALSACTDWPQCIAEEWLMHEREFGTLEDVLKCTKKIKSCIKLKVPNIDYSEPSVRYTQRETDMSNKGKKRKYDSRDNKSNDKKFRTDTHKKSTNKEKKEAPPPIINKHIEKDPKRTVFVSNLHPSVKEEHLKELFPKATNIDIIFKRKGKSCCYGYMQFATEEEAMTALARDRTPLDGRPVFISEIKPEKSERNLVFKYAATTEANKLFVRGLPKTKTKEDVEEIFKPFGSIDVRIVMHKNGQSKGIAYVEFENEEASRKALKATDQMTVEDHVISVAISAPPPKKTADSLKISEPIRHARSRLQVPLIPRSLHVKTAEKDKNVNPVNRAENGAPKPKTNADFRNMLLNK